MAAALVARGPVRSRSTEILCGGSFSIVVDQVESEAPDNGDKDEDFDARSDVSNASSRGSRVSVSKEETDAKLQLFKTEAASRLSELERLLDEHDQIIRELKRSESDSSGINYAGIAATPSFITPNQNSPQLTSRTAPTSPLNTHGHGQNFSHHSGKHHPPTQFPDVTPAFLKDLPKFSITTHNFSDPPKKKNIVSSSCTKTSTANDPSTKTTASSSTNTQITTTHDNQSFTPQNKITADMGSSSDPVITIVTEKEVATDTVDKTTNTEPNTPTEQTA